MVKIIILFILLINEQSQCDCYYFKATFCY